MARLTRVFQKIFAGSASNNGVFGSAQNGTKVLTNNVATLQGLSAYDNGWIDAIMGSSKFPPLEEFQSLNYINTYQLSYLFQEGIPEYNASTTYYQFSVVKKAGTYELYGSVIDNNTGQALTDPSKWSLLINLNGGGGTTLPVVDTTAIVKGSSDATKLLRFEVDTNVATGTTRVLTAPAQDGTIAIQSSIGQDFKIKAIVTATNTGTITAGKLILGNGSGGVVALTSVSESYNTGTSGAGGLDTGTIAADTYYYLYIIYNPTSTATDALLSLSSTSPTLPAGYTFYKVIGEVITDGSADLIGTLQVGNRIQYLVGTNLSAMPLVISGTHGATNVGPTVSASVSAFVPPTAVIINLSLSEVNSNVIVAPNANYGALDSISNPPFSGLNTGIDGGAMYVSMVLESTNIYVASDSVDCAIFCNGWITNLIN